MTKESAPFWGLPKNITQEDYQQMFDQNPIVPQAPIIPQKKQKKQKTTPSRQMPWRPRSVFDYDSLSKLIDNANASETKDYKITTQTQDILSNFTKAVSNAIERGKIVQRLSSEPSLATSDIRDVSTWYEALHDIYPDVAENYETVLPLMKQYSAGGGLLPMSYDDMQKAEQNKIMREKNEQTVNIDEIVQQRYSDVLDTNKTLRAKAEEKAKARVKAKADKAKTKAKTEAEAEAETKAEAEADAKAEAEAIKMDTNIKNILDETNTYLYDLDKVSLHLSDSDKVDILKRKTLEDAVKLIKKYEQTPFDIEVMLSNLRNFDMNTDAQEKQLSKIKSSLDTKLKNAKEKLMTNLYDQYEAQIDANNLNLVSFKRSLDEGAAVPGVNYTLLPELSDILNNPANARITIPQLKDELRKQLEKNYNKVIGNL